MDSVIERHHESPFTFYIPSDYVLNKLGVGDLVKLIFLTDQDHEIYNGEVSYLMNLKRNITLAEEETGMLYDLHGEAHMTPIVGMLYSAVKENSERLRLITAGMSQEEIDYKGPHHNDNSTAQLIRHILYVNLNWVYRIKGQALPDPLKEQYGPMIDENNMLPMVIGESYQALMSQYEDVIRLLEESCTQLTDADLDQIVVFGHQHEKQATIRWGLWHMADHCRYHQAHINQLRKWYRAYRQSI